MSGRNGSTRAWRVVRDVVLRRDGHTCQKPTEPAGAVCGKPATDAGHIVAVAFGGTDHPSNLRAECETHNSEDGGRIRELLRTTTKGTR